MQRPASAAVLVASCLVLAGCAADSKAANRASAAPLPTEAPPATFTPETGGIEGNVTNDELLPIGGISVGVVETGDQTRTAQDGRFSFSNLSPGAYKVVAEGLGYESKAQRVTVLAGEVATARFQLKNLLNEELPVIETVTKKGFIHCSINWLFPMNLCGHVVQDQAKFYVELRGAPKWKELVLELVWTPATPATGQRLELDVCANPDNQTDFVNCFENSGYYNYTWGRSPQVLRDMLLPWKDQKKYMVEVGDGFVGTSPPSVPVTVQQSFDLWISNCYVARCGEEYQARPPDS